MTRRERIDSIISDIHNSNSNDPKSLRLRQLYTQIRNIYNDPFELSQFMNVIRDSLLDERVPIFTGSPYSGLYRNFYSTFFNLLIDPSTYGSRDERAMVIRNNLRLNDLISSTVIKYDYYFTGIVVAKVNTEIKEPRWIYKLEDFILIHKHKHFLIWNTKTNKKQMFIFPDTDPQPNIIYVHKHIVYEDNKIAVGITVHDLGGEDEPPLVTYIGLFNFNTGEQHYHRFTNAFFIHDIKIIENTLLIGTDNSIRTLDVHTLMENQLPINSAYFILPYDNNAKLIIGSTGSIEFYNLRDRLFIGSTVFDTEHIKDIKFLYEDIFIVTTHMHIGICDLKTLSLIKQVDIPALEPNPGETHIMETYIRKVLILKDKIIVQTRKRVFIFDFDLNLKFTSRLISHLLAIDILPNNQLITIHWKGLIMVWEFEGFELHLVSEIESEPNKINLLFNGCIYALRNGQIVIYE